LCKNKMNFEPLTFLACPQCTFNRFMPSWYVFILLRLAAVFVIARPRLDVVRVLAVAAVLEVGYFYLWRIGIVAGYRRIYEEPLPPIEIVSESFSWIFQLGLIHVAVLAGLARVGFFKVRDAPIFKFRRSFLVIPCFLAIHFLQLLVASSTSSTGH
jgi:hypothetical protein